MSRRLLMLALGPALVGLGLVGCDDDTGGTAMPGKPVGPATRPNVAVDVEMPEIDDEPRDSAFVYLIDENDVETAYEFPPAKLWLRAEGDGDDTKVLARLFSDDPAEATEAGWDGSYFFFEMELALSDASAVAVQEKLDEGGSVRPEDVADAEWYFDAEATEKAAGKSFISFATPGGVRELQPKRIFVNLRPLSGKFVDVLLVGDFQPPVEGARGNTPVKAVRVRAVLTAETVGD
ncbi:MAG: hypothetical protein AAF561_09130 [Planctomycetota bacterium]